LKEFIESPHLESLLEVGKLGLTNPSEELHSYGGDARVRRPKLRVFESG
jgi:hypothetical protein